MVSMREQMSMSAVSRCASPGLCVQPCSQGSSAGHWPAGMAMRATAAAAIASARRTVPTRSPDSSSCSAAFMPS